MKAILSLILLFSLNVSVFADEAPVESPVEVETAEGEDGRDYCKDASVLESSTGGDIPWDAAYPIKISGVRISPEGDGVPAGSSRKKACACQDDLGIWVPGLVTGLYEPYALAEFTSEPGCMLTMKGTQFPVGNKKAKGMTGDSNNMHFEVRSAYWHAHFYSFPLMILLEMALPNRCNSDFLDFDMIFFTEIDPTWNDPEISFFSDPTALLFANVISDAACVSDAISSTAGRPIDSLFWCAGAWGRLYPLNGYVTGQTGMVTKTSLLTARMLTVLHKRLMIKKSYGDEALCGPKKFPHLIKNQYKVNQFYPIPEREGTHMIGEPAFLWGEWKNKLPNVDYIHMLWKYTECCSTLHKKSGG